MTTDELRNMTDEEIERADPVELIKASTELALQSYQAMVAEKGEAYAKAKVFEEFSQAFGLRSNETI